MVSKASDDLPEPLGPVTTVNFPSGRSTSTPLRLFWRAPRISMHPCFGTAVTRFFLATFEPTGDNSRWKPDSQISALLRETGSELFALLQQLVRNNATERIEKLFVLGQFRFPFFVIDLEQFVDAFVIDFEFCQIEIVQAGQPTDRRFQCTVAAFASIDHPFEHAHVVAETGPKKLAALAFAEPVHVKNERRIGQTFSNCEPMAEIIADVVAAERQHRHRIATDLADRAGSSGSC